MSGFWILQGCQYPPGFWILNVIQGLPIFVNMSGFWLFQDCHYAQASEFPRLLSFACFRKYDRVLNMWRDAIKEEFWMFQNPEFVKFLHMQALRFWICLKNLFWLWQGHEYNWSKFHRVLNMLPVLNLPGLRIWPGCYYTRVTRDCEYAWISLNMP